MDCCTRYAKYRAAHFEMLRKTWGVKHGRPQYLLTQVRPEVRQVIASQMTAIGLST